MLTFLGRSNRMCDGISRRSFLQVGGFTFGSMAALSLPQILQAEALSGNPRPNSHKAIINIFLAGGAPHQDMWEIKTEAPKEVRGEFSPISTSVPGIQIGECFPKIASMMDKFAIIRSIVGNSGGHDAYQCLSGWPRQHGTAIGGFPSMGSAISKMKGPVHKAMPPHISLSAKTSHTPWSEPGAPGFLGAAHQAFKPNNGGSENLTLNGVTLERLQNRKELLTGLDNLKREVDSTGMLDGVDSFTEAAFGVLTSSKLAEALDLSKEDPEVVARYGDGKPYKYQYDGAPTCNDHLLLARRLVQAGARSVSLSYGRWDSHGDNFGLVRHHGPRLDQAVSALVQDLEEKGMLDDVTVVVWGEFGRTPRINDKAGRDHWPRVNSALLAGGGMKTGQAIGKTNRLGEYPVERPIHFQNVISTLYHNLGIDTMTTTLNDPTGRPQFLVDEREPVEELV
ncbi:hypothetical protein Pla110_13230 [Polystyrenella longa]|uniref:DUF1501 domain-containing protein n=1 Tax=Polystyrenella longa TaxID=2528007 RepID=A0A518CK60_9PLAN|nr:DUF1501 domain-containing protein [Polystyrenella longa]QDU79612.1 hypothetical protein Pla110_13230 [Polystyrenella longa]